MRDEKLVYEGRRFSNEKEMINTLLHEANKKILEIDMGKCQNNIQERNKAKFMLIHLQHHFGECIPHEVRQVYNSLWSQMYRLEYESGYRHPYVKELLEKLFKEQLDNSHKSR
jgi:hypothetical protein